MKKRPFFVRLSTQPSAWRRLWLVGASCLWFGPFSLPTGAQADADSSSENASPDSDSFQVSDWTAQWIGRNNPATVAALGQQAPDPLLRKEFTLDHSIARATLRICGLGFYEAYNNGRRVGDQVLDPPPTTYNQTALYATFDVSRLVSSGVNAIGVTDARAHSFQLSASQH